MAVIVCVLQAVFYPVIRCSRFPFCVNRTVLGRNRSGKYFRKTCILIPAVEGIACPFRHLFHPGSVKECLFGRRISVICHHGYLIGITPVAVGDGIRIIGNSQRTSLFFRCSKFIIRLYFRFHRISGCSGKGFCLCRLPGIRSVCTL